MYKLVANINPRGDIEYQPQVVRLEDKAIIPFDEGNMDYQAYLAWLEEGNTPEEWTPNDNQ